MSPQPHDALGAGTKVKWEGDKVTYEIECDNCGSHAHMNSPLAKYCSDKCRYDAHNHERKKSKEALF